MEKQQERKTQRSMVADYYKVLQVPRNAKGDDLEKAARVKFKQISQAYDVLSDPHKRAAHDQVLSDSWKCSAAYDQNGVESLKRGTPPPYKPWSDPAGLPAGERRFNYAFRTPEDIFSEFFGGGGERGMFGESFRGATDLEVSGDKDARIPYTDICYDTDEDDHEEEDDDDYDLHYTTNFPKDREKDVQEAWPAVKTFLEKHGISCKLNLDEGLMSMSVSKPNVNPNIFAKAKVVFGLLANHAGFGERKAMRILNATDYEIIVFGLHEGGLSRKFSKYLCDSRKRLLVSPTNLKALRELTGCFIAIDCEHDFVFALGRFEGLRLIRTVVEEFIISNVSPEVVIRRIRAMDVRAVYSSLRYIQV